MVIICIITQYIYLVTFHKLYLHQHFQNVIYTIQYQLCDIKCDGHLWITKNELLIKLRKYSGYDEW